MQAFLELQQKSGTTLILVTHDLKWLKPLIRFCKCMVVGWSRRTIMIRLIRRVNQRSLSPHLDHRACRCTRSRCNHCGSCFGRLDTGCHTARITAHDGWRSVARSMHAFPDEIFRLQPEAQSQTIETLSMAAADNGESLLVEVKAVRLKLPSLWAA